tara:strand:- start:735 stop:1628 length:894 start_codon:yes stop_codon:yes gene_type:complete
MIVITGASGFIGWNLYLRLGDKHDVLLVDFKKRTSVPVMDPFVFLEKMKQEDFRSRIKTVLHQGACSDTTVYDPFYMMRHNFDYSFDLFRICLEHNIRFIYASSAAVYGDGPYREALPGDLKPKNIYGQSKKLFDEYVDSYLGQANIPQVVGLRYFNVYGPWESKKGAMASVMCQFKKQIDTKRKIKIFENSDNYLRDFIYVDDVVNVNKHFINNSHISGIFNCGTGIPQPFTEIPKILSDYYDFEVEEIPMPEHLVEKYQHYTQADTLKLRESAQYTKPFISLKGGISEYVKFWNG